MIPAPSALLRPCCKLQVMAMVKMRFLAPAAHFNGGMRQTQRQQWIPQATVAILWRPVRRSAHPLSHWQGMRILCPRNDIIHDTLLDILVFFNNFLPVDAAGVVTNLAWHRPGRPGYKLESRQDRDGFSGRTCSQRRQSRVTPS